MSKRRKFLSAAELQKIADEIDIENETSASDYDSDDSVVDPEWQLDPEVDPVSQPALEESSDEEDLDNDDIENVLREMALDEVAEEEEENQAESDEEVLPMNSGWTEYVGRHKVFPFTGLQGLQVDLPADISPFAAFSLIVDDEVIDLLVTETNRFAQQTLASKPLKKYSRMNKWVPTDAVEMKKFLGLTLWMGLVRLNNLPDYWASKGIYKLDIPRSIMSRNRFQLLLSMLHFNNNETIQKGERTGKIQPLVNLLQRKCQELFYPGEEIVVDETLVPWRGRLIFRQYIPNKAHRYGIKLFKLCSSDGYTWAFKIYSGKPATGEREVGLAEKVCLELCAQLLDEGRTLYVDNFYTSYELAKSLLNRQTHIVGTVRASKRDMPKEVLMSKIKKWDVISGEDQNGIVILKWKDTRDVRVLSTKHAPILVPIHPQKTQAQPSTNDDVATAQPSTSTANQIPDPTLQNTTDDTSTQASNSNIEPDKISTKKRKSKRATEKPVAIMAYNKGKAGIDLSDQMASYATTLRRGVKWYRKLGIELLLGTAVVNAWVLYKHASKKKMYIRIFRGHIASTLLNMPDQAQHQIPRTSANSYHHLSNRVNDDGKKLRRKCSLCYSKIQEEAGRAEARRRAKMVYSYCNKCSGQPQLCLPCFNIKHK